MIERSTECCGVPEMENYPQPPEFGEGRKRKGYVLS